MNLHRQRIGVILRTFEKIPELVGAQVERINETVDRLMSLTLDSWKVISRIDVMVASDCRFVEHDCGASAKAIRQSLGSAKKVKVVDVEDGDLFCGILNHGLASQARGQIDYTFVISSGARGYITESNIAAMIEPFGKGAVVSGLAIPEVAESVLRGCIANTFALWDTAKLISVGCFDSRSEAERCDSKLTRFLRAWSPEMEKKTGSGVVYYPLVGVEEILPLLKLVTAHKRCIAPVGPVDIASWEAPDPNLDKEGNVRHHTKIATKRVRQACFASMERADLSILNMGVIAN